MNNGNEVSSLTVTFSVSVFLSRVLPNAVYTRNWECCSPCCSSHHCYLWPVSTVQILDGDIRHLFFWFSCRTYLHYTSK